MTGKRTAGILTGCTLLLAAAANAPAAGTGIQVGPTLLFPSLSVTETRDDNIRLASRDKTDDWLTTVAPALRLVVPVRRFFLEAEGGLDFVRYRDNDGENSTNWVVGASAGAEFPGGLGFKVGDTYAARYLPGSQEYGPGEDTTLNTLQASAGYAIRDALRLEASWLRSAYTYDRSTGRERVESTVQADLSWRFRPRLSAFVEAALADYSYDSNTAQDGSATQAALGLTWEVTAKSTGFAKAGYQWKRYDDENIALGIEDASYYTLAVGLRHAFTSRTAARLDITRASQESDFPENPYYLRTAVDVNLSHRFTAKIYGRAGVRVAADEYPHVATYDNPFDEIVGAQTAQRSDTLVEGSVAVGFDVTRWLALEAAYGGLRRTSNFDTFEYDANRVSLSAKAAF